MPNVSKSTALKVLNRLLDLGLKYENLGCDPFSEDDAMAFLDHFDLCEDFSGSIQTALMNLFDSGSGQFNEYNGIHLCQKPYPLFSQLRKVNLFLKRMIQEVEDFWVEDEQTRATIMPPDNKRANLLWNMTERFNIIDVKTLCFTMHIDDESIKGDDKTAKIRELILFCERYRRLEELIGQCKKMRPNMEW